MDIPIRFKFYDKLKLYQDYLKKDSLTEKTKSPYWDYEKLILRWAFSTGHQHLGSPIGVDKLKHLFGYEERAQEIETFNDHEKQLISDINRNPEKLLPLLGNISIKGFADTVSKNTDGWIDFIRINDKGFLMGELLYEKATSNSLLGKRLGIYWIAIWLFKIIFLLIILTVIFTFFIQLKSFIEIIKNIHISSPI